MCATFGLNVVFCDVKECKLVNEYCALMTVRMCNEMYKQCEWFICISNMKSMRQGCIRKGTYTNFGRVFYTEGPPPPKRVGDESKVVSFSAGG